MGPESDPRERNILGVIHKVGLETGGAVINLRAEAAELISMIGGKQIHPVCGLPGGVSKAITAEQRDRMVQITAAAWSSSPSSRLQVFDDVVLANKAYVDLISERRVHATRPTTWAWWTTNNKVNFYDGQVRVTGPGRQASSRSSTAGDYLEHIAEHVEPWTATSSSRT